jgi:hypothetical protein
MALQALAAGLEHVELVLILEQSPGERVGKRVGSDPL